MSEITSLLELPKDFRTVIWDIRYPESTAIIGGKDYCPHNEIDENFRCEQCGAYKGFIKDMPFNDYTQKLLTELAVSPFENTIIITKRPISQEAEIRNKTLKTPKYTEYVWLDKYGSYFDQARQKVTHIIIKAPVSLQLGSSKYLVNRRGYDDRLLDLGKTMVVSRDKKWHYIKPNLTYYYKDFI